MLNHGGKQGDVAVIGGGLAGLTAAIYLAQAGQEVILLEKAKAIGGRAASQARGDFLMNLGPHALYIGGGGSEVLAELDVPWSGGKPTVQGLGLYQGIPYRLPTTPLDILKTRLFTIREKAAFTHILKRASDADPQALAGMPIGAWIQAQTKSEALRQALLAVVRVFTYVNAPELLSAGVFVTQLQLTQGVRYLDGGWQTLVAGLQAAADAHSVEIVTGGRVESLVAGPNHVEIELAAGDSLKANSVILAVDPATASRLLPDNSQVKQWADTAVPVRAAVLDVALSRVPRPEANFGLGIDEPLYLSNHSRFARLGPAGGHLFHLAKYLPVTATDPAQDEAELEAMFDLLQPGWRALMLERRFLPNMVVSNRLALASEGGLNGRPGYAVPHVPNLYLAGDWVGNKGWLADAALVSGRQAARLALSQVKERPVIQSG